jgi:hypothetical protein
MGLKTIINRATGEEIGATYTNECLDNEILVDELRIQWFLKPYFNFDTREFYEGATQEELDEYNTNNEQ